MPAKKARSTVVFVSFGTCLIKNNNPTSVPNPKCCIQKWVRIFLNCHYTNKINELCKKYVAETEPDIYLKNILFMLCLFNKVLNMQLRLIPKLQGFDKNSGVKSEFCVK